MNRTYYDGFTMRDVSYKSGDHIYCLPGDVGEEMYLAQIDSIFEDNDGQWVDCIWLERADDVKAMVGPVAMKNLASSGGVKPGEVFLCTTVGGLLRPPMLSTHLQLLFCFLLLLLLLLHLLLLLLLLMYVTALNLSKSCFDLVLNDPASRSTPTPSSPSRATRPS